jgi:hypothetical protein
MDKLKNKWPTWIRDDKSVVSCTEKIKVMKENFDELKQLSQDAIEDGLLMLSLIHISEPTRRRD